MIKARAAGTGNLSRRSLVRLASVLVLGVPVGAAVSLARTGLTSALVHDVVGALLTAVAAASVLLLVGTVAEVRATSGAHPLHLVALATTGAVLTGLAAVASLTLSTVVAETGLVLGPSRLLFMLDTGWPAGLLALGCLVVALTGLGLTHALSAARAPVVAGSLAGLCLSVLLSAARPFMGDLHDDDRGWRYVLIWVWLGVGLAVLVGVAATVHRAEGLLVGVPAAAAVAVVTAAGFVVSAVAFGGHLTLADVVGSLAMLGSATLAIGLPLAGAALLISGPKAGRPLCDGTRSAQGESGPWSLSRRAARRSGHGR